MTSCTRALAATGFTLLFLVLPSHRSSGHDIPFSPPQPVASGAFSLMSICASDVDGNGVLDVAGGGAYLYWFANSATNGSAWKTNLFTGLLLESSPHAFLAGDIDTDGDSDFVVLPLAGGIAWMENVAAGSSWTTNEVSTNAMWVYEVADLDRDGDPDILGQSVGRGLRWYENRSGTGSLWYTNEVTTNFVWQAMTADVNGDGALDLVTASPTSWCAIAWYDNTAGDGSAWTRHIVYTNATGFGSVSCAAVGDLDGDGGVDLVADVAGSRVWFRNVTADGQTWQNQGVIESDSSSATTLQTGDVDQDGDLDILAAVSGTADDLEWYENLSGVATNWADHVVDTNFVYIPDLRMADLDDDGDQDLVISRNGTNIWWYRNNSIHRTAAFAPGQTVSAAMTNVRCVAAADLDGDGHLDLVTASSGRDDVSWFSNPFGDGSKWSGHQISGRATGVTWVATADVDNDGDEDVLAALDKADRIACYRHMVGSSPEWTTNIVSTNANGPRCIVPADVDGDGNMDAVVASFTDDTISWFENQSGGTNWVQHLIYTNADGARAVSAADLDGDGDVDVAYASYNDDTVAWCRHNLGSWSRHEIATNVNGAYAVYAGDVNGDGAADVLSAAFLGDQLVFHRNADGAGLSWDSEIIASNKDGVQSIAISDLDLDGDLDAVFAAFNDNTLGWLDNPGRYGSRPTTNLLAADEDGVAMVTAADLDGDGDDDLAAAVANADAVRWYENRGGSFVLHTTDFAPATLPQGSNALALGIAAYHRGRTNDSPVRLDTFHFLIEESAGDPLSQAEASNLVAALSFYHDRQTNGVLDGDDFMGSSVSFPETTGVFTIHLPTNAWTTMHWGKDQNYFAVLGLHGNARYHRPHQLRLTHLTAESSTGADATTNIPVDIEYVADQSTKIVEVTDADSDGDGMPNSWEDDYPSSLDPSVYNPPENDYDGDQVSDRDEYLADTDPTDSNNYIRVLAISNLGCNVVFYRSTNTRYYDFDCASHATNEPVWVQISSNNIGRGGINAFPHTNDSPTSLYRIRVELP